MLPWHTRIMELIRTFFAQPTPDILVQIGAFTGFITFMFKVFEFWRDYGDRAPRLRTNTTFTGDFERGNTVLILNSSKVGTTINDYTLDALPPRWWSRVGLWRRFGAGLSTSEFHLEDRGCEIVVPGHGHAPISFAYQDHFIWGARRKDDLYLRIWTSARDTPYSFLIARAGGD